MTFLLNNRWLKSAGLLALMLGFSASATMAQEWNWKKHIINGQSEFEAAGTFDVVNDGDTDIVSGA